MTDTTNNKRHNHYKFLLTCGKVVLCGLGLFCGRNLFYWWLRKYKSYPLGPFGYPFVGCLPYMRNEKKFYIYLTNAYGAVTMFYLGMNKKIVLVNDSFIFCQLVNNKYCLYRPTGNKHKTEPINLVISNGKDWNYRRKLMHKHFSIIINDSSFMETEMTKSINNVLIPNIENELKLNKNKLFEFSSYFNYISFNIIYACLFNAHLDYNCNEYNEFSMKSLQETTANQSLTIVSLMFGYSAKWILSLFKMDKTTNALEQRRKVMFEYTFPKLQQWYEKHFDLEMDSKNNVIKLNDKWKFNQLKKCYGKLMIDEFFENNKINVSSLLAETRVLFRAGIDGTAETANYGIVLIAKKENINIQEMVYKEIHETCVDNNLLTFSLKIINKLHYFRALMYEIMRISCVPRSGVSRITVQDVKIEHNGINYVIPKNSIIMPNIPKLHIYDEKLWGKNPKKVNLKNWLDENDKFKYNENFVLFGVGKRDCPGKSFAKKSLYFIFGLLIHQYKFTLEKECELKQDYSRIRKLDPKIFVKIQKRTE